MVYYAFKKHVIMVFSILNLSILVKDWEDLFSFYLKKIHKQQMLNVRCQNVSGRARTGDLPRVRRT